MNNKMKVIITMAGLGSRFQKIGFSIPKHEIIANNKTLFEWSLLSLEDFFNEEFILIARKGAYNLNFINEKMSTLGIEKYSIVEIDCLTDGQASTVLYADKLIKNNDSILIYNIDTYIREGAIQKSQINEKMSGFIPSFVAEGDKWSFVKCDENMKVHEVSEKVRISNLGTVGLYYFKNWSEYKQILTNNKEEIIKNYKEAYIAPMYKYLIESDKDVYASIIQEEDLHVLGTPDDIKKFDSNYLMNNKDQGAYRKFLLENLFFDKLDELYLKTYEDLSISELLEYIVYLSDTSQFERMLEVRTQFDFLNLINDINLNKDIVAKVKIISSYMKFENNTVKISFTNYRDLMVYQLCLESVSEVISLLMNNKKTYLNENSDQLISPLLLSYVLNKAIDQKIINNEFYEIVARLICSKHFGAVRRKKMAVSIIEFSKKYNPDFLLFSTNKLYNQHQSLKFALSGIGMNEFYPGVIRIERELQTLTRIKNLHPHASNIIRNGETSSSERIALCITGAMRLDYKAQLEVFEEKMASNSNVDVFIATWKTAQTYPGLTGPSILPDALWLKKHFEKYMSECPREILKFKDFVKILPETSQKLINPISEDIDPNVFKEIFGDKVNLEFLDENEFHTKYSNEEGLYRRGDLNQAKMFYSIWQSHKLVEESTVDYGYVIRARPDWVPLRKFDTKQLYSLQPNEICSHRNQLVGPTDLMLGGAKNDMFKLNDVWENALRYKDLSPFECNGVKLNIESHKLLEVIYGEYGIVLNTSNKLMYSNEIMVNSIKIPDVSEELEKDIVNMSEDLKDKYRKFFTNILPVM